MSRSTLSFRALRDRHRWRSAALACVLALSLGPANAADTATAREAQFKAAYLLNFVKFIDWPPTVGETLTVCFVGGEGVYDALIDGIDEKRIGNRRLAARRLDGPTPADGCNAVYVDEASSASVTALIGARQSAVLTISDAKSFASQGGMIELFTDKNRLRFNINVDAAQKAGLRISSSLLSLAATVKRGES